MKLYTVEQEIITDTRMVCQSSEVVDKVYLKDLKSLYGKSFQKTLHKWGITPAEFYKVLPKLNKIVNWSHDFGQLINIRKIVTLD